AHLGERLAAVEMDHFVEVQTLVRLAPAEDGYVQHIGLHDGTLGWRWLSGFPRNQVRRYHFHPRTEVILIQFIRAEPDALLRSRNTLAVLLHQVNVETDGFGNQSLRAAQ